MSLSHRFTLAFCAVLALLVLPFGGISTASAHSSVPIKMLCGDQTKPPVVTATFEFTGAQLNTLVETMLMGMEANALSPRDKCGIVDVQLELELQLELDMLNVTNLRSADEWTRATAALAMYCSQTVTSGQTPMPYVTDNTSGYHATNHHATYRIANGAKGVCAVCPYEYLE
ncbi:MAG: hypothetical protein JNM58_09325 [Xanthomonadaceae bacterium]|nr:hypothetical protein [Xanthomonadaceae bacterium]